MKKTLVFFVTLSFSMGIFAQFTPGSLPRFGMGVSGPNFYTPLYTFTNLMRQSNAWEGATSVDAAGWPTSGPTTGSVYALLFADNENALILGNYTLTWEGDGDIRLEYYLSSVDIPIVKEDLSGTIKKRIYNITAQYKKGFKVTIYSFPTKYVKNVCLTSPGTEYAKTLYHPNYLKQLKPFSVMDGKHGVLRFMGWQGTVHSPYVNWSDRVKPYTFKKPKGFPDNTESTCLEQMITLCNEAGYDMWVCLPHAANDGFVQNMAHLISTGYDNETGIKTCEPLKPELRVWIEYSNEVWNGSYTETTWVNQNNVFPGGDGMNWNYAKRAEQIMILFEKEFTLSRLVRIMAGWSANDYVLDDRLTYTGTKHFDVGAITSYFSHDVDQSAFDGKWYSSNNYTSFFNTLDSRMGSAGTAFKTSGDTHDLQHQKADNLVVAKSHGVPLIAYEGGSHLMKRVPGMTGTEIIEFLESCHRQTRMYDSYKRWLSRWEASGFGTHMELCYGALYGDYGHWGMVRRNNDFDSIPTGVPTVAAHYMRYKAMLDYFNVPYPSTFAIGCEVALNPSTLLLAVGGETKSLAYTLKGDCAGSSVTVRTSASWLTPAVVGGNITATAPANSSYERTALVEIVFNGDVVNAFEVKQTGIPLNGTPSITKIANKKVAKNSGVVTINLAGIDDGDASITQNVTITASADNAAIIASINVNYTSPNATGTLTFTPVANAIGSTRVTVTLKDDGGTGGGAVDTKTISFLVDVKDLLNAQTIQGEDFDIATQDVLITANNLGYYCNGYADFGAQASSPQYYVYVKDAGTYNFQCRYANGDANGADRLCMMYVNGTDVKLNVNFPATGTWDTWAVTAATTLTLKAGENLIRFKQLTPGGPNLDQFAIAKSPTATDISTNPCPPLGEISNAKQASGVSLFPNPTSSNVNISGLTDEAVVSIINMNGQVMYSSKASSSSISVDVSEYYSGIYIVIIEEKDKIARYKISVAK